MPEERGMGLRVSPDSRDNQYPVRLLLDPLIEKFFPRGLPGPYQHYNTGPVLNQGATGTCVGHGWTARMHDAPIMQKPTLSPFDLYRLFVKEDEWDDNDWEANTTNDSQLQSGTSVRAGAQVLRKLGLIKNFLWAREVEDLRAAHLAKFGGFVIGGPWTSNMMDTDIDGFVNYTGVTEGGHCVATKGWHDRVKHRGRLTRAMRCKQSWGQNWGQGGYFWISEDDLAKWFADHSEFCLPVEVRVAPLKIEE
jgi:hypothetical protein